MITTNQKHYSSKFTNNKFNSMIASRHAKFMKSISPAMFAAIKRLGAPAKKK